VNKGLTAPRRTTPSHAVMNSTTATVPMMRARTAWGRRRRLRGRPARGGAFSCRPGSAFPSSLRGTPQARAHFLFDQAPDVVLHLQERRGTLDAQLAGTRERDGEDALHASRPRGHDDDAVREVDGLVDLVGDEDRRPARLLPDAHQLRLHELARLR